MTQRQLGPVVGATLLCQNIDKVSQAYQNGLGYSLVSEGVLDETQIQCWNTPKLRQNKTHVLASSDGQAWLRLVEDANSHSHLPLKTHGWMSLETNVADVDVIRNEIDTKAFTIIGEPAYLQVSDAIKAMQVVGPANEVTYLTHIERPVPPFELPMTSARTSGLFIPVLCTPSRDDSLAFYQSINKAQAGLKFDTKITILNSAWNKDIEHQYQVATLQLDGKCLFEIDQVPQAQPIINNEGSLPSGIAMVTCVVKNIDEIAAQFKVTITQTNNAYYPGSKIIMLKGAAGELIELVGA
ncbi:hypothetical protein [Rheinheimera salexigens]|uniref:VOC domain-containing protein n=1 Tax=Rheinheimera salexigens TaxID=1628148 RepID=A0A1E7Q6C0_9GAMM|nr:hypothetical protein [Rheinheimera salexigens]OEY69696.1 hypothetical protein BI198_09095 [Rheinheimera salexigens]